MSCGLPVRVSCFASNGMLVLSPSVEGCGGVWGVFMLTKNVGCAALIQATNFTCRVGIALRNRPSLFGYLVGYVNSTDPTKICKNRGGWV